MDPVKQRSTWPTIAEIKPELSFLTLYARCTRLWYSFLYVSKLFVKKKCNSRHSWNTGSTLKLQKLRFASRLLRFDMLDPLSWIYSIALSRMSFAGDAKILSKARVRSSLQQPKSRQVTFIYILNLYVIASWCLASNKFLDFSYFYVFMFLCRTSEHREFWSMLILTLIIS